MEKFQIEADRLVKDYMATREQFADGELLEFERLFREATDFEEAGSYDAGYDEGQNDCDCSDDYDRGYEDGCTECGEKS